MNFDDFLNENNFESPLLAKDIYEEEEPEEVAPNRNMDSLEMEIEELSSINPAKAHIMGVKHEVAPTISGEIPHLLEGRPRIKRNSAATNAQPSSSTNTSRNKLPK